jgi:hypothetical protein
MEIEIGDGFIQHQPSRRRSEAARFLLPLTSSFSSDNCNRIARTAPHPLHANPSDQKATPASRISFVELSLQRLTIHHLFYIIPSAVSDQSAPLASCHESLRPSAVDWLGRTRCIHVQPLKKKKGPGAPNSSYPAYHLRLHLHLHLYLHPPSSIDHPLSLASESYFTQQQPWLPWETDGTLPSFRAARTRGRHCIATPVPVLPPI